MNLPANTGLLQDYLAAPTRVSLEEAAAGYAEIPYFYPMDQSLKVIRLSELAESLGELVRDEFAGRAFRLVAETSDIKNYEDRSYCFLTLVEKEGSRTLAKMEAVIWSRYYHIIADFEAGSGVRFEKNIRLMLEVQLDYHPVYGLKLQVSGIDTSFTLGEIEKQRQQNLTRLLEQHPELVTFSDGEYITRNRLLTRPLVFQRIAVVAAPDSDGLRDFRHELANNAWQYTFKVDEYLCRVQGAGAEDLMIAQLELIHDRASQYDVVVIARGGGGQLDFGPFDTYKLGLAVAAFPLPVITGIGHERNVSIADLMCHLSLKTPTRAASFLLEHNRAFEEGLLRMDEVLQKMSGNIFSKALARLENLAARLSNAGLHFLRHREAELEHAALTIKHLQPENILARGYAMVIKEGHVMPGGAGIFPGDNLDIRLKDSIIHTKVISKEAIEHEE